MVALALSKFKRAKFGRFHPRHFGELQKTYVGGTGHLGGHWLHSDNRGGGSSRSDGAGSWCSVCSATGSSSWWRSAGCARFHSKLWLHTCRGGWSCCMDGAGRCSSSSSKICPLQVQQQRWRKPRTPDWLARSVFPHVGYVGVWTRNLSAGAQVASLLGSCCEGQPRLAAHCSQARGDAKRSRP